MLLYWSLKAASTYKIINFLSTVSITYQGLNDIVRDISFMVAEAVDRRVAEDDGCLRDSDCSSTCVIRDMG